MLIGNAEFNSTGPGNCAYGAMINGAQKNKLFLRTSDSLQISDGGEKSPDSWQPRVLSHSALEGMIDRPAIEHSFLLDDNNAARFFWSSP